MSYLRSRGRRGHGSTAGVGKEVQHLYRAAAAFLDLISRKPVPVGRLLRKKSRVLKAEGLQVKRQLPLR